MAGYPAHDPSASLRQRLLDRVKVCNTDAIDESNGVRVTEPESILEMFRLAVCGIDLVRAPTIYLRNNNSRAPNIFSSRLIYKGQKRLDYFTKKKPQTGHELRALGFYGDLVTALGYQDGEVEQFVPPTTLLTKFQLGDRLGKAAELLGRMSVPGRVPIVEEPSFPFVLWSAGAVLCRSFKTQLNDQHMDFKYIGEYENKVSGFLKKKGRGPYETDTHFLYEMMFMRFVWGDDFSATRMNDIKWDTKFPLMSWDEWQTRGQVLDLYFFVGMMFRDLTLRLSRRPVIDLRSFGTPARIAPLLVEDRVQYHHDELAKYYLARQEMNRTD